MVHQHLRYTLLNHYRERLPGRCDTRSIEGSNNDVKWMSLICIGVPDIILYRKLFDILQEYIDKYFFRFQTFSDYICYPMNFCSTVPCLSRKPNWWPGIIFAFSSSGYKLFNTIFFLVFWIIYEARKFVYRMLHLPMLYLALVSLLLSPVSKTKDNTVSEALH